MPNIAEAYSLPQDARRFLPSDELVLPTCYVGVEAELERTRGKQISGLWLTKADGSLHDDGLEYVFSYPLYGQDIVDALHILEQEFSANPPSVGVDTSLHVHVDVRDLTSEQLGKMILLYIIYEQVLFNYCAPEREDNVFCLSVERQKSLLSMYNQLYSALLRGETGGMRLGTGQMPRYMGMNVSSINKFGTLEFRGHRGEWRAAPILRWINILLCLKRAAMDDSIPTERPYVAIKNRGVTAFTQDVFGQYYEAINNDNMHEQIHTGMQLARTIVNMGNGIVLNLTAMGARNGVDTINAIAAAHGRAIAPNNTSGYEILYQYIVDEFSDYNAEETLEDVPEQAFELIGAAYSDQEHNDWYWDMVHSVCALACDGRYSRIMRAIQGYLEPEEAMDYDPDDEAWMELEPVFPDPQAMTDEEREARISDSLAAMRLHNSDIISAFQATINSETEESE